MTWFTFLRVLHVLLGVFWAGALFLMVLFVEPVVRALGPDGGKVMGGLNRRRFTEVMLTVAFVTLATGMYLYWAMTDGFAEEWMGTPFAMIIGFGAATGILAFLIGLFVTRPTMKKVNALAAAAAGGAPTPETAAEVERLRRRMRLALRTIAVLLLITIVTMAGARYV